MGFACQWDGARNYPSKVKEKAKQFVVIVSKNASKAVSFVAPMFRSIRRKIQTRSQRILANPIVNKILDGLLFLPRVFVSGIRAKLAWFTGSLLFGTIIALSFFFLAQQSEILTESYEREARFSRTYISALVLELDNISQSLIRIEEFRDRISKQRELLKKYRTIRSFEQENQVSFLGVKTNLFGALGTKKVRRQQETYYSEYLSREDIELLERSVKQQLQTPGQNTVSEREFLYLQQLARNFVASDNLALSIRKEIAELKQTVNTQDEKAVAEAMKKLTPLEDRLKKISVYVRKNRFALDSRIAKLLADSKKRKIKELGLDTSRFRLQTYPIASIVPGETAEPTLDTKIFDPSTPLNQDLGQANLEQELNEALLLLSENLGLRREIEPSDFEWNNMELQSLYSPHFRHPQSTRKAKIVTQLKDDLGRWSKYLAEENKINSKLALIPPKIEARLEELKAKRPPLPPFRDKDFVNLYKEYSELIERRESLLAEFLKQNSQTVESPLADAVSTIRDTALEDQILLRFVVDSTVYLSEEQTEDTKKLAQDRRYALRDWIYSGRSETPTPQLKYLFKDGIIGNSRTEAEQILWKLDTTPMFIEYEDEVKIDDIPHYVLGTNFAGVIRTLVDRTEGLQAIRSNRDRAILSAFVITTLAILLAVFISGFVVQKIKRIIESAEDVGNGNLNVEFQHGGTDEFGNLTVALNHMVTGLRDREKIKGILGSMVDPVVVGEAMKDLAALKRGTEKRVTAFFSDVAGFSTISEKLTSVELASLLNEYLSAMTMILKEEEGVLDKYIGDAIVGIWNAPIDVENHSLKAVRASLKMVHKMEELRRKWKKSNKYIEEARDMTFRIGLNTGLAKVGFMGTDSLASYTMMGDSVNLAARLEAAGKDYGVKILASDPVYQEVKDSIYARKVDLVRVKGKKEPVVIYEIIDEIGKVSTRIENATRLYEEGFDLYLKQDWKGSTKKFQASLKERDATDISTYLILERIELYKLEPPGDSWDGVFTRDHK